MNHLGDDKQCFPRNQRNFTLNIAAQIHLSQSSNLGAGDCSAFSDTSSLHHPSVTSHGDLHLLPVLLPFPQARPSLLGSQACCCVLWLEDKAIPPRNASKCFPVIGFLRNMLERKLLSPPSETGARDFTGSPASFLARFSST